MGLAETPTCDFGLPAPDFRLADPDGRTWTLAQCRGKSGLLMMFICNHCPYVVAVRERLVVVSRELIAAGIGVTAVMSNDYQRYPDDSPEHMLRIAEQFDFPFPYLVDSDQSVARAYGAVCTPDFFGYNANLELQYRGRLDDGRLAPPTPRGRRELVDAMLQVATTGQGPTEQVPSAGCSIKWRS